MKKIALVLVLLSYCTVFAASLDVKTVGSMGFFLNNEEQNNLKFNHTTSVISHKNDVGGITVHLRWSKALGSEIGEGSNLSEFIDYLWIDSQFAGGELRIGKQRLGIKDNNRGIPFVKSYLENTMVKSNAISYSKDIDGYKAKFYFGGNVFFVDEKGLAGDGSSEVAILLDNCKNFQFGTVYSYNNTSNVHGASVFFDFETQVQEVGLLFQAYYDLNDSAGQASRSNYVYARNLVNIGLDYAISPVTQLYSYYTIDLNSNNHDVFMNNLAVGFKNKLSQIYTAVFEYSSTQTVNSLDRLARLAFVFEI